MTEPAYLDDEDRRRRRLFARTEAWLYAVPDWVAELRAEPGYPVSFELDELPNDRTFRVVRPTEREGVNRAELARRLSMILVVYRRLSPAEQRFVQLRYWTQRDGAGLSHLQIARELRVHRNTVSNMRQRVVEEFMRGLFGV